MLLTQLETVQNNPDLTEELNALLDAFDGNPTKEARRDYRKFLRAHPELWSYVGNIVEQAAFSLIGSASENNAMLEESLKTGVSQMPKDMALPTDGPLEQLLIQQVVLCWLRYGLVEYWYTSVTGGDASFEKARYWEQRLNAAQRRYLRAVETLARIRKLQLPALQVNIGGQQVNQVNAK